jgi:hypothetical protein
MPKPETPQSGTFVISLSAEEGERERALRERFTQFWATATGSPRTVYDAFIAASPLVDGASLEAVDAEGVRG